MIFDEEPNFKVKLGHYYDSFGYSFDYENIIIIIILIILGFIIF